MFKLFRNELLAPEDAVKGGTDSELSQGQMINFLAEDDKEEVIDLKEPKKEEPKEEEEEKEETGEKEDEEEVKLEDELEEELEEVDEEKLELMTPVRRKEILAKFPTLFKDFPYLERAYYREQQFTEILPTIEDAKTAVSKAQTLDLFEQQLLKGDTENILKSVKDTDIKAFYKIVDDYLPTLAKVDEKAYYHVLGNTIKNTIVAMVRESQSSNNDALKSAAQILNQFVFGSSEFVPPEMLSKGIPEKNEAEDKLTQREQEFITRQFETVKNDLNTKVDNVLRSTITANIDPKESMTEYVRKNASREALDDLQSLIETDSRFKVILDKLWDRAFDKNFSKESIDQIRSAYLSKAKTLLPSVIKKARNEALKGLGKRVKSEDTEEETPVEKKGPLPVGRTASTNSPKTERERAKQIPTGMRSVDYLMQD